MKVPRCQRPVGHLREECVARASEISQSTTEPISVHLSGGYDSEILALSFLEAQVPFQAVSFTYSSGNDHDLAWAREFCVRQNVPHREIPFDDVAFMQGEAVELMRQYQVPEPFTAFEIKRIQMTPGYSVLGNGDPDLVCDFNRSLSDSVDVRSYRSDSVVFDYQKRSDRAGCFAFFRSSPEIFYSFLSDPIVQIWVHEAHSLRMPELAWWKYYVYKKQWPQLRRRNKATGYERFAPSYLALARRMMSDPSCVDLESRTNYWQAIGELKPDEGSTPCP